MEDKKTFGEYICMRRKELGLTQREFAGRLYVTESAVSKWERGMSYPDITLLLDICAALDVTEHELLTASVDTQKRAAERMAEKYQRLTRNFCVFMGIILGTVLLVAGIVCITNSDYGLFPIVVSAVMILASIAVLPIWLAKRSHLESLQWVISLGVMVGSIELLIFFCCLRAGSLQWFPTIGLWILFGGCLLLLPMLLRKLPLPAPWNQRKALLCCGIDLLVLLLAVAAMNFMDYPSAHSFGHFYVSATAVLFGTGFIITPIALRQLPLPETLRTCKTSLFITIQSGLLLLMLLACCWNAGGMAWDVCPIVESSVLFGLCVIFLPIILRQAPLPEKLRRHKALLYFSAVSIMLLAMLGVISWARGEDWFFPVALPCALTGLILPWGLLGSIRYLPANGWFRASAACGWTGLWLWLYPWLIDKIMMAYGWAISTPYALRLPCDFSRWDAPQTVGWNLFLLVLAGFGLLAALFAGMGAVKRFLGKQQNNA
ncbi:MAG: helix-turn-helix domain-containing protein [Oscillospiraceae bacterium]|nr:helix-turn-helix domain-containing protein [Oscillospiraceae bacterium]